MHRFVRSRKINIFVLGLVAGLFLFSASFAYLLDNILFNDRFHANAVDKLGIPDNITELIRTMTAQPGTLPNEITPAINNAITSEFVHMNIETLIGGLTDYFRGNTKALPDLYLADINSSLFMDQIETADTASTVESNAESSVTGVEMVNLQAILMILGEQRITGILHIINLFQFLLSLIPILTLLLFIIILVPMLLKTPQILQLWLKYTASAYGLLCMLAGCLLQLLLYCMLPGMLSITGPNSSLYNEVLANYAAFSVHALTILILLSGSLVFVTVLTAIRVWSAASVQISVQDDIAAVFGQQSPTGTVPFSNRRRLQHRRQWICILTAAVLSSSALYLTFRSADMNFDSRNLNHAVTVLNAGLSHTIIDARKDQVCLLELKVLDNATQEPLQNARVEVSSVQGYTVQQYRCTTGPEGTSSLLLDMGKYRLVLDAAGLPAMYDPQESLSCEFDITEPGPAQLVVSVNREADGLYRVESASLLRPGI